MHLEPGPRALHVPKWDENGQILADHWYRQFMSERYQEIKPGKFGWQKIYKRNEVLDTWIYARAAAEFKNISAYTREQWILYKETILDFVE